MRGLHKFLSIEDKNYSKIQKEKAEHDLRLESYRMDNLM